MQDQGSLGWLSFLQTTSCILPASVLPAFTALCLLPVAAHASETRHPQPLHHPAPRRATERRVASHASVAHHAPIHRVAERHVVDHRVAEHHVVAHRAVEHRAVEHRPVVHPVAERHVTEHHAPIHRVAERHVVAHHAVERHAVEHRVAERHIVEHRVIEHRTVEHRATVRHVVYHPVLHHPVWHGKPIIGHAYYRGMSCVPFARADSGIDLAGNAWQWWGHAAGKYARGSVPQRGAVLNFRAIGRMRLGHVAVVARVINRREITVDQANWPGPGSWGNITRNVPVVDVSPNNDWTAVRVGLGRPGSFGSVYPTYGFIYDHPDRGEPMLASAEPPAPTPRLGPAPHDLRSPAERIAASRARYNEVAEAPAIAAPDNGHDLAVGSSLRLDAPDRSLR